MIINSIVNFIYTILSHLTTNSQYPRQLRVLKSSDCPLQIDHQHHPDEEIRRRHQDQKATLFRYLRKGSCKHIYLDIGTNIGVQIRKLYEPSYYPSAPAINTYNEYFGKSKTHSNVCSIGFEASSNHTDRLLHLQEAYRRAGFPTVIFTDTAASVENGIIKFYRDLKSNSDKHEWGASVLPTEGEESAPLIAIAVDLNEFIHETFQTWKSSYSYNKERSKVYAKLDIEGSEYWVVPHMLGGGSLCLINRMTIEWHLERACAPQNLTTSLVLDAMTRSPACKNFSFTDKDDESYGSGEDNHPLPNPLSLLG